MTPRTFAKEEDPEEVERLAQEKDLKAQVESLEEENKKLKTAKSAEEIVKAEKEARQRLERQGVGRLSMAKDFLRSDGLKDAVREAFEKIVRENKGTKAADEAAKILKEKWGHIVEP